VGGTSLSRQTTKKERGKYPLSLPPI